MLSVLNLLNIPVFIALLLTPLLPRPEARLSLSLILEVAASIILANACFHLSTTIPNIPQGSPEAVETFILSGLLLALVFISLGNRLGEQLHEGKSRLPAWIESLFCLALGIMAILFLGNLHSPLPVIEGRDALLLNHLDPLYLFQLLLLTSALYLPYRIEQFWRSL